jgi:hypothetical protein
MCSLYRDGGGAVLGGGDEAVLDAVPLGVQQLTRALVSSRKDTQRENEPLTAASEAWEKQREV